MQHHYISYKQSVIHYTAEGSGSKILLCLHGYGEDCSSFAILNPLLQNNYTIIAIDFPFHGETKWNEPGCLQPEVLIDSIQQIIKQTGIDKNRKLTLLGYSMGGRAALHIINRMPQFVERAVLIAPDGLHKNFWYFLATQTYLGNRLFKFTMKYPQWLFQIMKLGRSAGMLNKSVYKFARNYLDDTEARELLYKRWTAMRRFTPHLQHIKTVINEHNIAVRFLFGSFDRIILSKRSDIFKDCPAVKIEEINDGHKLITKKNKEKIEMLLRD